LDGANISATVPPEHQNDAKNEDEETLVEGDSSPPVFGHLSDNIFQANFAIVHNNQHSYNTRSKSQS
jgi:hypothetical protein